MQNLSYGYTRNLSLIFGTLKSTDWGAGTDDRVRAGCGGDSKEKIQKGYFPVFIIFWDWTLISHQSTGKTFKAIWDLRIQDDRLIFKEASTHGKSIWERDSFFAELLAAWQCTNFARIGRGKLMHHLIKEAGICVIRICEWRLKYI